MNIVNRIVQGVLAVMLAADGTARLGREAPAEIVVPFLAGVADLAWKLDRVLGGGELVGAAALALLLAAELAGYERLQPHASAR